MKRLLVVSAIALLAAGCASQGDHRVAQAECKIYPITTASVAGGKPKNVSSLDRRQAEMALGTSNYRMRNLQRPEAFNNVEEALHDCYNR